MKLELKTLTTSQAARMLRVSTSTLRRRAESGAIPCERTRGGHRRFRRTELEELSRRGEPTLAGPADWIDALLESEEPVKIHARLFELRIQLGSWWRVAERLMPELREVQRRREEGQATVIQCRHAVELLVRAVAAALTHVPRRLDSRTALLISVPEAFLDGAHALLELCLAEQGWRTWWAGPASTPEVAEELRRRRPDLLVVAASALPDPAAAALHVRELAATAGGLETPVALIGPAEWPNAGPGTIRLREVSELRAWLEAAGRLPQDPTGAAVLRAAGASARRGGMGQP